MLELRHVSLALKGRTLIKPFSLVIQPGEIASLMGPSGCGKSPLMSFVAGDLPSDFEASGEVLLEGRTLQNIAPNKRNIGRLFQDDLLFPHMTVGENLLFAIPKLPRDERLALMGGALQDVELEGYENRPPHTLSGGQKSRVALMRALLANPHALLLDEPFNKLDQELRGTIRTLTFKFIRKRNIPALLVTHDGDDAPEGARVCVISKDGEISHA